MMKVAVLMPSKGRPKQLKDRVKNLLGQDVPEGVELVLVLAVQHDDLPSLQAASDLLERFPDASIKLVQRQPDTTAVDGWNLAYTAVADSADWLVLGADDIVWGKGWLQSALATAEKTGAQVVGLHDGHTNLRHYGAHYMVTAEFCNAHLGGVFIPPMYKSWWFDREVCEKAAGLGLYAPDWNAVAEHHHPDWGKAEMDATYEEAWPLHEEDRKLYEARKGGGFPVDYQPLATGGIDATDAAVKLAAEHGIALETVKGTGTNGRILKSDVENAIASPVKQLPDNKMLTVEDNK